MLVQSATFPQLISVYNSLFIILWLRSPLSYKAIPLQAWTVLEGSRRLRLPYFKTIGAWRWHRPSLPHRKYSWYSFLLEAESTPGPQGDRKDYVNDTIGNRTRDLPACSVMPQPTAPPHNPILVRIPKVLGWNLYQDFGQVGRKKELFRSNTLATSSV